MELFDAICKRKSIRKYSSERLPEARLSEIENIIKATDRLYNNIDLNIQLVKDSERMQRTMKGIIGNFGKILAPHYLIITSEAKDGYLENAGFAVEGIVLKLTSMGIATCWMGGHVKEDILRAEFGIGSRKNLVVFLALGYPENADNFIRKDPSEAKRKAISDFVIGSMDDTWKKIMDAVRIAPSAANSQPWRFVFASGVIHVFCMKPSNFIMKRFFGTINRVDMGIALRHVDIAAKHLSSEVRFEKLVLTESESGEYIISIMQ